LAKIEDKKVLFHGKIHASGCPTSYDIAIWFLDRARAEDKLKHAGVLLGGERRLLEISRALVMEPDLLLVDEPSIVLEPRFIDMVFEILDELQHTDGKTIIMLEQNAKKGLEFADIGYVLVAGKTAIAAPSGYLRANPEVGRLFLGG